jgi:hypothetical protein
MRAKAIFGVDGGGQRAAAGGRVGGWRAVLPAVLWAARAVGVRAPARGADAGWRAVGAAAAGVLRRLRRDARAPGGVERAASPRRIGGDRRSAPPRRPRRWAPCDRAASWSPTGHCPRLVARRPRPLGAAALLRDASRLRAGPGRARARHAPGLDPRRRRRGARDRRQGVGASIRQPASRRVGARGVADRRAADRNAAPAAVAGRCSRAPARPRCHPAARGGCGSSAAATLN